MWKKYPPAWDDISGRIVPGSRLYAAVSDYGLVEEVGAGLFDKY